MKTKICSKCNARKVIGQFNKDNSRKSLLASWCKQCRKWYRATNRKQISIIFRKYNLKRYNITIEEYNILLKQQYYNCAICKKHSSNFKRNLGIDHNHKTGEIRGLLCNNCNRLLGNAKDSAKILKNAIEYINKGKEILNAIR